MSNSNMEALKKFPKIRISLYRYTRNDLYSFIIAFKSNALQQGWNPFQIERVMDAGDGLDDLGFLHHLNQFCVITKMPKGVRVRKGKIIEQ